MSPLLLRIFNSFGCLSNMQFQISEKKKKRKAFEPNLHFILSFFLKKKKKKKDHPQLNFHCLSALWDVTLAHINLTPSQTFVAFSPWILIVYKILSLGISVCSKLKFLFSRSSKFPEKKQFYMLTVGLSPSLHFMRVLSLGSVTTYWWIN